MRLQRAVIAVAGMIVCCHAPAAGAGSPETDGQIEVGIVVPGNDGGNGAPSGSGGAYPALGGGRATPDDGWDCRFYRPIGNDNGAIIRGEEVFDLVRDSNYARYCSYHGVLREAMIFTYNPNDPGRPTRPADPERLSRVAIDVAKLPGPDLTSAPPKGGITPVNLPVWFWADTPAPNVATARADANNVATATATPTGTVAIDPGDGSATVSCPGGGVPWARGRADTTPGACLHTYLKPGSYTVTTTMTWSVRYEATIIGLHLTGVLPDETTRSTRTISITELETRLRPN